MDDKAKKIALKGSAEITETLQQLAERYERQQEEEKDISQEC